MATIAHGAPAPIHPNFLTARESALVRKAIAILESKRLRTDDVLRNLEDFSRYLCMRFAGLVHEQGHVVYLDIHHRLIDADSLSFGTQSSTQFDIRHIAYRAMHLGAESVVLAHNHPSGNPIPSDADVRCLTFIERGLGAIGIEVTDSFVVTQREVVSIRRYREWLEKTAEQQRAAQLEQRRAERAATRATNKAAKAAAQLQGVAA